LVTGSRDRVFAAVAGEAGRLLAVELAVLVRCDNAQHAVEIVGTWTSTGACPTPAGSRLPLCDDCR
jgi:hypothetical protein